MFYLFGRGRGACKDAVFWSAQSRERVVWHDILQGNKPRK